MTGLPCVVSVEDDGSVFDLIQATLSPLPIQLYHAQTGREAIDLICQHNADLVILDILLPDINGWNVLKQIGALDIQLKGVIVLTAHANATHRVIARLQEVTAFINKPFKPSELRAKVSQILDLPY